MDIKDKLLAAARESAANAYAPYSGFKVGAALLSSSGNIYGGCNVENASYGLTVCAERIAAFKAVSAGEREFPEMCIYTDTDTPFYPCGACRQVLSEFNPEMKLTVVWKNGKEELNLNLLLPKQFKL
ncbi:MAG: cytidine deaminase [Candidatus Cloacimonetes bacterium]|nr:cytidine deaminase [Candidatus Cloacimonadota bacterium]